MSHVFQLSDELYTKLAAYAARQKQTPEKLFQVWVNEVTHTMQEEFLDHPILQVSGMFAIGELGWADKHDEYLAASYLDDHADNE